METRRRKTEGCLTWCTKRFWTVRLLRIVITAADSRFCDLNLVDILARRERARPELRGTKREREMERERERERSEKEALGRKEKIGSWSIERTGIRLSVYTVERPDQEPWIIHRESETRCFGFGARTDVVPCLFALLVDSLSTLPPRLGYFWHPVSACLSASCFNRACTTLYVHRISSSFLSFFLFSPPPSSYLKKLLSRFWARAKNPDSQNNFPIVIIVVALVVYYYFMQLYDYFRLVSKVFISKIG